jgi:hypothetical protein
MRSRVWGSKKISVGLYVTFVGLTQSRSPVVSMRIRFPKSLPRTLRTRSANGCAKGSPSSCRPRLRHGYRQPGHVQAARHRAFPQQLAPNSQSIAQNRLTDPSLGRGGGRGRLAYLLVLSEWFKMFLRSKRQNPYRCPIDPRDGLCYCPAATQVPGVALGIALR